jgi:Protein of unknown function (DUF2891)
MRRIGNAMAMLLASVFASACPAQAEPALDTATAGRFAALALYCVQREYPNKITHQLNSAEDAKPPRQLTPAFYGCFDWHSSVHGHWLLVRLLRQFPQGSFVPEARRVLAENLSADNLAGELRYLQREDNEGFERPYGLAWLLQLAAELREWDDPQAHAWSAALAPLETEAAQRFVRWLPKLTMPIRAGEHSQTAFAFGLVLDWSTSVGNDDLRGALAARVRDYYLRDRDCPLAYEPSGQDFLSPCLAEADLLRRVLSPADYAAWLNKFLPRLPRHADADWLIPGTVIDPSDGKLAHLDGLNLSRAWMLQGIASGLPERDARRAALLAAAKRHADSGVAAVSDAHYAGAHWLGSFATYLLTRRGL